MQSQDHQKAQETTLENLQEQSTVTIGDEEFIKMVEHAMPFLQAILSKKASLYNFLGYTKRNIEDLYRTAYNFYTTENYKEAEHHFIQMVYLDQWDKRGWMGYGASAEMLKHYDRALIAYACVANIDPEDPWPAFHTFDCLIKIQKYQEASQVINRVILLTSKQEKYKKVRAHAIKLRDILEETLAQHPDTSSKILTS